MGAKICPLRRGWSATAVTITIVLCWAMSGCSRNDGEVLYTPSSGELSGYAADGNTVYFLYSSADGSDSDAPTELWRLVGRNRAQKLGTVQLPGCDQTELEDLRTLTAGLLGAKAYCIQTEKNYYATIRVSSDSIDGTIVAPLPSLWYDAVWDVSAGSGWVTYSRDTCA